MKKILKFRNSDEEFLQKAARDSLTIAGALSPEIMVEILDPLIDWYIEDQPSELLSLYTEFLYIYIMCNSFVIQYFITCNWKNINNSFLDVIIVFIYFCEFVDVGKNVINN